MPRWHLRKEGVLGYSESLFHHYYQAIPDYRSVFPKRPELEKEGNPNLERLLRYCESVGSFQWQIEAIPKRCVLRLFAIPCHHVIEEARILIYLNSQIFRPVFPQYSKEKSSIRSYLFRVRRETVQEIFHFDRNTVSILFKRANT